MNFDECVLKSATLKPLTREAVAEISEWEYEKPYDAYSFKGHSDGYLQNEATWGTEQFALYFNEKIIGQVACQFDEDKLWVGWSMAPRLCGKGYGDLFVKKCVSEIRRIKSFTGTIYLRVAALNLRAVKAYQKAGFVYCETIQDEVAFSDKIEDFYVMKSDMEKNTVEIGNFEIVVDDERIKAIISEFTDESYSEIRRVCERYGEEADDVRYYDVYAVDFDACTKMLKKADEREAFNYEKYLSRGDFAVPKYYGKAEVDGEIWILTQNVVGDDLRDMTDELALATADTLSQIQNAYWQNDEKEFEEKKTDDRFEVYYKRILRRAEAVKNEAEIKEAYKIFLERQLTCPRTLSNGDFLQFNVMHCKEDGKVYAIDWGFGGIMPYSLDIARFIAHATVDRSTFPFYMNDEQKRIFCDRIYEKLKRKPDYQRYLKDIKLAVLNEYVEFVEADEDEDGWYYSHAVEIAKEILEEE